MGLPVVDEVFPHAKDLDGCAELMGPDMTTIELLRNLNLLHSRLKSLRDSSEVQLPPKSSRQFSPFTHPSGLCCSQPLLPLARSRASCKPISRSTGVRDLARNLTIFINYNTISAGLATIIDAPVFQDRELVVRPLDAAKTEPFIVIVKFWIPEKLALGEGCG